MEEEFGNAYYVVMPEDAIFSMSLIGRVTVLDGFGVV